MLRISPFPILALTLAACGGSDVSIAMHALSGTIGGQPWSFVDGSARSGFEMNQLDVELHAVDVMGCSGGPPMGASRFMLFFAKAEVGSYAFSLQQNATFVIDDGMNAPQNKVATTGKLSIDTLTDTMVKGGIAAHFDDGNDVSGTFEIPRCMAR